MAVPLTSDLPGTSKEAGGDIQVRPLAWPPRLVARPHSRWRTHENRARKRSYATTRQARYVRTGTATVQTISIDETSRRSRPASILAFHRLGFTRLDIREARIRRGYLPGGSRSWNFFLFVRSFVRSFVRRKTRCARGHEVIIDTW